jgi:UDP-N-acetylglucosamine--N-acetylmuramyl-(pentapeptide) pyrophosphoryl-undecaprenol N-acetylglucosamine transferase
MKRICLAGGGTGGHVTPLLAIGEEWRAQGGEVLYVGAAGKIEETMVPAAGFELAVISGGGRVKGMGAGTRLRSLVTVPGGVRAAAKILDGFGPDVVIGAGGYASFAAGAAAVLKGIPLVLCEQNSIPGLTNRVLSRVARRVCTSFKMTASHLDVLKVVLTGNPVRAALRSLADRPAELPDLRKVTVLGGSQGARFLNTTVASSLAAFLEGHPDVRVTHQCGQGREEETLTSYEGNPRVEVIPFVEDMAALLAKSDLVVCRAGATTIAELTTVGLGAILVPFPFATDDHQVHNARAMERAGGAEVIIQAEFDGDRFVERLSALHAAPGDLGRMASASRAMGRPDAAAAVLEVCREVVR